MDRTAMGTDMGTDSTSLLLLLNWMSPTFPIGSFAYSHGLEQAIADGHVRTQEDVQAWIADLLQSGSGWNDAALFSLCWSVDNDELNQMALALAGSAERYMETTQLGRNFGIAAEVWTDRKQLDGDWAYAVAAGAACVHMGIPQEQAVTACLQGYCAALVSVAVRLVPLGQTSGLKVLRNLAPLIAATATRACAATLDDLGSNCISADIATMKHETLETRIFRT